MAEFEVKCDSCDSFLSANFYGAGTNIVLNIEPCEKCLDSAKDEGYQQGYEEAIREGE